MPSRSRIRKLKGKNVCRIKLINLATETKTTAIRADLEQSDYTKITVPEILTREFCNKISKEHVLMKAILLSDEETLPLTDLTNSRNISLIRQ